MTSAYEIKSIAQENPKELALYSKNFDTIIIALPLYIHSMPGITMRFIEHLESTSNKEEKSIGFIIQSGFQESSQSKYVEAYFETLARQFNRKYLGTFIKAGSGGTNIKPEFMSKKLFKVLNKFGEIYDKTHCFDKDIINKMRHPYKFKGLQLKFLNFLCKSGIETIGINTILNKNKALDKKFDKPFA